MARTLHGAMLLVGCLSLMLAASLSSGCIIPVPLSADPDDAGVNAGPIIVSAISDRAALPEFGTVQFTMGAMAGEVRVLLQDADVDDRLTVKIFVDYNMPLRLEARARCEAVPTGTPMRTATCKLNSLCTVDDLGDRRNMAIMVFDRPPAGGEGDPPFQQMEPNGLSSYKTYSLSCQPAESLQGLAP